MRHRNCNVKLDDLHWDRPDLDCEPQQARGIPRNLRLDETEDLVYEREERRRIVAVDAAELANRGDQKAGHRE